MRRHVAAAVAVVALIGAACSDDDDASDASVNITMPTAPPATMAPSVPLVGTTWEVTSIVTGSGTEPVPAGASMTFADDGTVAVDTGCNTGSATVSIDAQQIQIGPLAMTKKACDADTTRVETAIVAMSMGPLDYHVEGDQLVLTSGANSLVLTAATT